MLGGLDGGRGPRQMGENAGRRVRGRRVFTPEGISSCCFYKEKVLTPVGVTADEWTFKA